MGIQKNKREFTRALIHMKATLTRGEKRIDGWVKDVSMRGLFFLGEEYFPEKTECLVELCLSGHAQRISAKGRVVRLFADGLGVEFTEIDLDSFHHLRNLVRMNASDVSRIETEFMSHLGLKRSSLA